mmetsp:Transcript_61933/g.147750  ORF Transcript_61933/g.147750 Transcript_61933/m.147750 type:complete len:289 (+) Transcript_61933:921-1787(+)
MLLLFFAKSPEEGRQPSFDTRDEDDELVAHNDKGAQHRDELEAQEHCGTSAHRLLTLSSSHHGCHTLNAWLLREAETCSEDAHCEDRQSIAHLQHVVGEVCVRLLLGAEVAKYESEDGRAQELSSPNVDQDRLNKVDEHVACKKNQRPMQRSVAELLEKELVRTPLFIESDLHVVHRAPPGIQIEAENDNEARRQVEHGAWEEPKPLLIHATATAWAVQVREGQHGVLVVGIVAAGQQLKAEGSERRERQQHAPVDCLCSRSRRHLKVLAETTELPAREKEENSTDQR